MVSFFDFYFSLGVLLWVIVSGVSGCWGSGFCFWGFWGVSGGCLGGVWGVSGGCLGGVWGVSGGCLGKVTGELVGDWGNCWKEVDAEAAASRPPLLVGVRGKVKRSERRHRHQRALPA